jgi:diacylglycerol kinase family enzyme
LLKGRVVRLDVGICNGRRFACVFGAGVDAWAVKMVHLRRRRGLTQWHYVPYAVRGLLSPASWEVEVEVDGRPFARGLDQVAVGNTHSYGGPMEMTSAAAPDDGLLDVMCVHRESLPDLLGLAACGFLRALHWSPRIHYARGRRIVVTSHKRGVPYELDGDDAGVLPAEIVVQAGAARVLAPPGFRILQRALPSDT